MLVHLKLLSKTSKRSHSVAHDDCFLRFQQENCLQIHMNFIVEGEIIDYYRYLTDIRDCGCCNLEQNNKLLE